MKMFLKIIRSGFLALLCLGLYLAGLILTSFNNFNSSFLAYSLLKTGAYAVLCESFLIALRELTAEKKTIKEWSFGLLSCLLGFLMLAALFSYDVEDMKQYTLYHFDFFAKMSTVQAKYWVDGRGLPLMFIDIIGLITMVFSFVYEFFFAKADDSKRDLRMKATKAFWLFGLFACGVGGAVITIYGFNKPAFFHFFLLSFVLYALETAIAWEFLSLKEKQGVKAYHVYLLCFGAACLLGILIYGNYQFGIYDARVSECDYTPLNHLGDVVFLALAVSAVSLSVAFSFLKPQKEQAA